MFVVDWEKLGRIHVHERPLDGALAEAQRPMELFVRERSGGSERPRAFGSGAVA